MRATETVGARNRRGENVSDINRILLYAFYFCLVEMYAEIRDLEYMFKRLINESRREIRADVSGLNLMKESKT